MASFLFSLLSRYFQHLWQPQLSKPFLSCKVSCSLVFSVCFNLCFFLFLCGLLICCVCCRRSGCLLFLMMALYWISFVVLLCWTLAVVLDPCVVVSYQWCLPILARLNFPPEKGPLFCRWFCFGVSQFLCSSCSSAHVCLVSSCFASHHCSSSSLSFNFRLPAFPLQKAMLWRERCEMVSFNVFLFVFFLLLLVLTLLLFLIPSGCFGCSCSVGLHCSMFLLFGFVGTLLLFLLLVVFML